MTDDDFTPRLPQLCDQAAAQVFDLLNDFIQAFDAAYGHQIRRHYQLLDSMRHRDRPPSARPTPDEDPPF